MRNRLPIALSIIVLITILALYFYQSACPPTAVTRESTQSSVGSDLNRWNISAPVIGSKNDRVKIEAEQLDGRFSPDMSRVVDAIHKGKALNVRIGDESRDYIFRPQSVTADHFKISAGPDKIHPSSFAVFDGKQLLPDNRLVNMAKLAVVNDTLSMLYSTENGSYLIEQNEAGKWISRTLISQGHGSTWGQWACDSSNSEIASATLLDSTRPAPQVEVEISMSAEVPDEPEIGEIRVSHPYFRYGSEYDSSLKDIFVLMVSSKSQTGSSSNLSSRAASYFSYIATMADIYERQLGMRVQLQELVMIPSDSAVDDIDPTATMGDLEALRTWTTAHRPQSTYKWGHMMGWSNVGGSSGGTVGRAWINSYGSSFWGYSVNERSYDWRVITHEVGHNVGADHTGGGIMNPSINTNESFFTKSEGGAFTGAKDVYDYMYYPTRAFVTGPEPLRHPDEMPFANDDTAGTPVNTDLLINPLTNDLKNTPLYGQTNTVLTLVEVGQVFPMSAGTASVSGDQILFKPTAGFTGNVWFTYTVRGNVGNSGKGWLHSADVVVTVGGNNTSPGQSPATILNDDIVKTNFAAPIRINPLLNDEGSGRLWSGNVEAINFNGGALVTNDGAFHLVDATIITGNGSVTLEKTSMSRNGVTSLQNSGYIVYTPGSNEPNQVEIQYTVKNSSGTQSTGRIFLNLAGTGSIAAGVAELSEITGRTATVTFTRTGSTTASEEVDFSVSGTAALSGAASDVAIAGFKSFDPFLRLGKITIPAGQSSASLIVSAMQDTLSEGSESLVFTITKLQNTVISQTAKQATITITDGVAAGEIVNVIASENFESFPLGSGLANGWTNASSAPGVWTANKGGTPTTGTGPSVDHTLGTTNGTYLYREANGNTNQQADLTSPAINLSGAIAATAEFYYHMYGRDMGSLRVDVFSGGSWHLNVIPVIAGQQQSSNNSPWKLARFDASAFRTADFRIRLSGVTGGNTASDMAIDDFAVGVPAMPTPQTPVIIKQPSSQSVDPGKPIYLSVIAEAYPAPTYQWKKNGVILSGATRSFYAIAAAQSGDAGNYTCEVTSGSTVTSAIATVKIISPPAQPAGLTAVSDGNAVRLNWVANNEPDFASYKVYRSSTLNGTYNPIGTGVLTNSYVDSNVTQGTTYHYKVSVVDTDTFESVLSAAASIQFFINNHAPQANAGPDQTVILSGNVPMPWTPAHIPGTAAWYDPADATKVQASGTAVNGLLDKSGNNLHLSQTDTALQPVTGSSINGLNAINFTGDIMTTSSNPFGATINNAFVIAVHKVDAVANGNLFNLGGSWTTHAPWSDGKLYFDTGGASAPNRISATYGVSPGSAVLTSWYGSTSDNVQQVYKNGALLVGDSSGHAISTSGNITVGGSGATYQDTTLGEFIIINGTVDAATRQKLEGYLAHKWGLTASLPANHPYKSEAPTTGGYSAVANLSGTASDADSGPLTTSWTMVSKPTGSTFFFSNPSALDTTAYFSSAGDYTLRLTANDGKNSVSDEIIITVNDGGGSAPVVSAGPDQTVFISGTGPVAWTPAHLTNIATWFDPSDAGTITSSGSAVSQLRDKSGNGAHLNQGTASLQPATGASINGLNAINFTGDIMTTASNPFGPTINNALVIAVHKVDALTQGTLFYLGGSWTTHAPWNDGKLYFDTGGSASPNRVFATYGVSTGSAVLTSWYGSTSDNVQQVYKNGSLLVGDSSGHAVSTSGMISVGGIGTNYQDTTLGEFIIINGTVDAATRQKLEGYLAHKWGMTASLPAAHPYKSAAPQQGDAATTTATLAGSASDPDNDPLTTSWTVLSKPAGSNVTFSNASALNPTVTFDAQGDYTLRLTATDGAASISDDVVITVDQAQATAYQQWLTQSGLGAEANGAFDADANGDGIANGMGWLLGMENANDKAHEFLPQMFESGGDLSLSFKMLKSAQRGSAILNLQYSRDLGITDPWSNNTIQVPDVSGAVNGVEFEIIPIEGTDHNHVHVNIPASTAGGGGKVFARLQGMLEP